jgi:hypothetical protein
LEDRGGLNSQALPKQTWDFFITLKFNLKFHLFKIQYETQLRKKNKEVDKPSSLKKKILIKI